MSHPKIVLCAVDLTEMAAREVRLAAEICETFGARLVLHHNVAAVAPGLTRVWEWKTVHRDALESPDAITDRLHNLMRDLPATFPVEAAVTVGSIVPVILDLAATLPADLIVLGSHGWSTEDHTSVAERVLRRATCPVLTVHDPAMPDTHVRMGARPGHAAPEVVVPIDLRNGDGDRHVLAYAFDLARVLGLRLHLLHVHAAGTKAAEHEAARRRLAELVPADLAARVECHVESGDPVERIMGVLCERLPAFAILGEHAHDLVRRVFTRDTAREMLHRAPCPVWFVPPQ